MPDEMIGKRWKELLTRIKELKDKYLNDLSYDERLFLNTLEKRLNDWKGTTFVTVAQMNKLTRLEQDMEASRFTTFKPYKR